MFAVKHPLTTFLSVLEGQRDSLYFSHSISEPRRLHDKRDTKTLGAYLEDYSTTVTRIKEHYTVYEPTAIDEYRFEGPLDGPKLTARWPFLDRMTPRPEDIVWSPPPPCHSSFAFPAGWEIDNREIPAKEARALMPLLWQLSDILDRHITGRDYQLIDQSKLTFGFCPLFNGNASEGVEIELRYASGCKDYGLSKHLAVVCPPRDRQLYVTRALWDTLLEQWRKYNTIVGNRRQFARLQDALRKSESAVRDLIQKRDTNGLAELLRREIERFGMYFQKEGEKRKPMGPDPMATRADEAHRCASEAIRSAHTPPYFETLTQSIWEELPKLPLDLP